MKKSIAVIVLLVSAYSLRAESNLPVDVHSRLSVESARQQKRPSRWFWISAALLGGAVAADSHSSWGRVELNPLVRSSNGRFGMQGVAIKSGIAAGTIGLQYLLLRQVPKAEKAAVLGNIGVAGLLGSAAIYNHATAK